jgi:cytochrome c oxidase subunit II
VSPEISVLTPAGVQASLARELFDEYLVVSLIVLVLVLGAIVLAVRRPESKDEPPRAEAPRKTLQGKHRAIGVAVALTVATLGVLLVMAILSGRALASLTPKDALPIEVVARRWWWEVTYPDPAVPSNAVRTAFEIHVPVGRPVEIRLKSPDVIHSFWAPSLGPKIDVIPGKNTAVVLRADREGAFLGMCSEFCGTQHANMRFLVIAEREELFQAWLTEMRKPARAPTTDEEQRGQTIFVHQKCGSCHTIHGTDAFAAVGPDLTHVASRTSLAMGAVANDDESLRHWILNPHDAKPGVIMPAAEMPDEDVRALTKYLRSLR